MNDYSGYVDRHANVRDRKLKRREREARMRGERSVFEMLKAQQARDRATLRKMKERQSAVQEGR